MVLVVCLFAQGGNVTDVSLVTSFWRFCYHFYVLPSSGKRNTAVAIEKDPYGC